MVGILKDIPIENIKIVPCRVNGLRGIMKSSPVGSSSSFGWIAAKGMRD
jgi:hypothetical protein